MNKSVAFVFANLFFLTAAGAAFGENLGNAPFKDSCADKRSQSSCNSPCWWEPPCRPGRIIYQPPLSLGDEGRAVYAAQKLLNEKGIPVEVDGKFGLNTADAVMAFQKTERLSISGKVDEETGKRLIEK